ncbi:MAG: DUF3800 domain-containing protein [Bacilli bacterium]|jgi:hypothetical protein
MRATNSFSFFCDESHPIKHDGYDFFVLGTAYCLTNDVKEIESNIIKIKDEFGYRPDYEIKWSKINGKNIEMVKRIIKYIRSEDRLFLRVLIATNKKEQNYTFLLKHEPFYKSMYTLLIKKVFEIFDNTNIERIELNVDRRNTHSEEELKQICKSIFYDTNISWANPCCVDSTDHQLIQCIDIIIGATSYEMKKAKESDNKLDVIATIKREFLKRNLTYSTQLGEHKYNVFVWRGAPYGERI